MTPDAIKLAREELGWSQSECAKQAGVSIRQMRSFEVGGFVSRDAKRRLTVALQTEPPPAKPKVKRKWKSNGRPLRRFTRVEASEAGRKGGEVVSQDREHMARIGRKGGLVRKAVLPALLLLASCVATNEEIYEREKAAIAAANARRASELVKPPKVTDMCATYDACCAYWCHNVSPCDSECDGLTRKKPQTEPKPAPVQTTKPEEDT